MGLARPVEARDVLRVDRVGHVLLVRRDADPVQRGKAPALACQGVEADVVVVVAGVEQAQAKVVAVALVAVGRRRSSQEVRRVRSG